MSGTSPIVEARESIRRAYYGKARADMNDVYLWGMLFGVVIFSLWNMATTSALDHEDLTKALLMTLLALVVWNTKIVSLVNDNILGKNYGIVWTHLLHLFIFFLGAVGILSWYNVYVKHEDKESPSSSSK